MRVWALVASVGLLIAAALGAVATATTVVAEHGLEFTYAEMHSSQFFSGTVAYDSMNDEGSAELQAGLGLLLAGIMTAAVAGLLLLLPTFMVRVPAIAATILVAAGVAGAVCLIIAPLAIAAGASAMTDGAVDGGDAGAGYWLPISGFIAAALTAAASALIGLAGRFGWNMPEPAES